MSDNVFAAIIGAVVFVSLTAVVADRYAIGRSTPQA